MNEENTSNLQAKTNLFEKIKNNKKLQIILVIILSVIAVFILLNNTNKKETNIEVDELTSYVINLEYRLENLLSTVKGVGKVNVIINIESGRETVLATEYKKVENDEGVVIEEKPIIINGKTVVLKELVPKISGIIIVAEGAQNINVLTRIQQATMSLLNIELNQIEILTMN